MMNTSPRSFSPRVTQRESWKPTSDNGYPLIGMSQLRYDWQEGIDRASCFISERVRLIPPAFRTVWVLSHIWRNVFELPAHGRFLAGREYSVVPTTTDRLLTAQKMPKVRFIQSRSSEGEKETGKWPNPPTPRGHAEPDDALIQAGLRLKSRFAPHPSGGPPFSQHAAPCQNWPSEGLFYKPAPTCTPSVLSQTPAKSAASDASPNPLLQRLSVQTRMVPCVPQPLAATRWRPNSSTKTPSLVTTGSQEEFFANRRFRGTDHQLVGCFPKTPSKWYPCGLGSLFCNFPATSFPLARPQIIYPQVQLSFGLAKSRVTAPVSALPIPGAAVQNHSNTDAESAAQVSTPLAGPSRPPVSEFRYLSTKTSLCGLVTEPEGKPDSGGGFSDVWKCRIRFCRPSAEHPTEVAVKVLREVDLNECSDGESHQRMSARFQQECVTWSGLVHPNIVPLIGYTVWPTFRFISPWYKNGNLPKYMKNNPNVDRLKLLRSLARALQFLHSKEPRIVHGDIKPDNILIDDQDEPRITDFGLATILGEEHIYTVSHHHAGTFQWMAPEQLMGSPRSCESDTYGFGCLIFWVMTSEAPFAGLRNYDIMNAINDRTQLFSPVQDWNRYPQVLEPIRDLIRECWSFLPEGRPPMSSVKQRLAAMIKER